MFEEYKKLLAELVAIKTVSSDSSLQEDCKKTALFLENYLQSAGFTTQCIEGYGNPILVGSYEIDPTYKTCLIYGHYDVQPAQISDGWDSEPFLLTEKDERFFGRGVMDDKGQILLHMVVVKNLIQEKKLHYNITFISEGNEEMGSPFIKKFVEDHKELLSADFIMISDGEQPSGRPAIELGYRGLVNMELTIRTSTNDLHSGLYGGAAPNAAHEASRLITTFIDEKNTILVDGFYDDVDPLEELETVPFDFELYKKNTGAKVITIPHGLDLYTHAGLRPTIDILGMTSGYNGEGVKTALPSSATLKISARIVKSQTPQKVKELIEKHIKKTLPDHINYELKLVEAAHPSKIDTNNDYVHKAVNVLEKVYQQKPIKKYVGGTEPVIAYFQEILNIPQLLIPFANEDGHMHGINENFAISNIKKGIEFSKEFFSTK